MAETRYDLKLVVDADTSEAQRKLDAIGGGAPATAVADMGTPSPAAEAAAADVRRARAVLGGSGSSSGGVGKPGEEFGRKAGDVAGKMIGKAVAGFIAHEVAGTVFANLKTTGGDNRTVNKAEAATGGALKYGAMGAMVGGLPGMIIGGIVGAGMGYYQEQTRQRKAEEARDLAIREADYARERGAPIAASDSAFSRSLDMAGGWRQRIEMMRARRDEISSGEGGWSVRNLESLLKGLDPESAQGKRVAANLEIQKNRVSALDQQILQEGLAVAPGRLEPGDVGDAWSKRGIGIGATIDVSQVNEKIMGEVQSCRALLEKIANMGTDNLHQMGAMQRAVFE